jgi:ribosomal protein S18 acetylase RimI-like enzyme
MSQDFTFTVRLATSADVDSLTEIHCASFRPEDNVPVMLGKRYVRAIYRWQVSNKEAYTLVAESDGQIIGFGGICDGPFTQPMFMACLGELFRSLARNPLLLFKKDLRQQLFSRLIDDPVNRLAHYPGVAQAICVAVDAEFRRKGVESALWEAAIPVSKSRGSKAILFGTYKSNHPIRSALIQKGQIEMPELETSDLVFYLAVLDPTLPEELGIAPLLDEAVE